MVSKQENQLQKKMDIFYDYYIEKEKNVKNLSYLDVVSHFKCEGRYDVAIATMLGNLNYQVENGGISQWISNGYAENTLNHILRYVRKAVEVVPKDEKFLKWLIKLLGHGFVVHEKMFGCYINEAIKNNNINMIKILMNNKMFTGTDIDYGIESSINLKHVDCLSYLLLSKEYVNPEFDKLYNIISKKE